jgi:hypothetical protein
MNRPGGRRKVSQQLRARPSVRQSRAEQASCPDGSGGGGGGRGRIFKADLHNTRFWVQWNLDKKNHIKKKVDLKTNETPVLNVKSGSLNLDYNYSTIIQIFKVCTVCIISCRLAKFNRSFFHGSFYVA